MAPIRFCVQRGFLIHQRLKMAQSRDLEKSGLLLAGPFHAGPSGQKKHSGYKKMKARPLSLLERGLKSKQGV